MPTASKGSTILVTGSNGFIAAWIIDILLKRGYTIRASVRTLERGKHLQETFKSYGDKLQLFAIGDMTREGAFDDAVKGVEGIVHTAATVNLDAVEPSDIIDPAVQGITGIMTSAMKYGSSLKRIVVTSSCAAVISFSPTPVTISEKDWNNAPVEECKEKGKDASGLAKYAASKTLAEKAGWEFFEKHKGEISWDVTFLNPPWVFGPVLHDVPSIDKLNDSNMFFYNAVVKNEFMGMPPLTMPAHGWVDVRDVAEGHVRSLEVEAAGNERIILCAGPFVWQDVVDGANSLNPSPWLSHTAPFAKGESGEKRHTITWDTSKEKRILGLKFKTIEEMCHGILIDYEKHGWN